jgi:hypothetical protein
MHSPAQSGKQNQNLVALSCEKTTSKHKTKTMHRAKTQRRQEKQNQIFVALSCEKQFQISDDYRAFCFSGEAE